MARSVVDRRSALETLHTILAADCACQVSDLTGDDVVLVEAREVAGRRRFPFQLRSFTLLTLGHGVVISCNAERLAWAEAHLLVRPQEQLFSISTLALIDSLVAQDGQRLGGPYLHSICSRDTFRPASTPESFRLEMFTQEQMVDAYRFSGFDHALSYRMDYPSPDKIAVAAWHQGRVVGMAGVGADSDQLWQIGVDVAPGFQGMGVGKALVSRATEATLDAGRTPYYTTLLTNIPSGNTARSVGYQWAWTDAYVRER